jgi:hypothetical protein
MFMISYDPYVIPPLVAACINKDPLTTSIREMSVDIGAKSENLRRHKEDIVQHSKSIEDLKIHINIFTQKLKRDEVALKKLVNLQAMSTDKVDLSFLEVEKLEKFFSNLGLKFIVLSVSNTGNYAYLRFVRPSKPISYIYSPPYLVTIKYSLRNGLLIFHSVAVDSSVTTHQSYTHPHVSSNNICLGNYLDVMNKNDYSLGLDGYQEQVLMIDQLLSTYNPDSPYHRVDEILTDLTKVINITEDKEEEVYIDLYSYTNIVGSCIDSSSNYLSEGCQPARIVGRELYEEYFKNIESLTVGDIKEDLICSFDDMYNEDNSAYEELDKFINIRNSLKDMLKIDLIHPNQYSTNYESDEGEEIEELSYSEAQDLTAEWEKEIKAAVSSNKLVFNKIVDLNNVAFGGIYVSN